MDNKFTYIIVYRHRRDRLVGLKRVADWVNSFKNSHLIIVEQDKHPKIKYTNIQCEYIFTKSDRPFNKAWGFNIGLKYVNTDKVIFGDSDLITKSSNINESVELLDKYDMVSPYNKVIDLSKQESNLSYRNILKIDRNGRTGVPLCGGIVAFNKDSINKIAGWSEIFEGWGCEDDLQTLKVKRALNYKEINSTCYHLYHNKEKIDKRLYIENIKTLNRLKKLNDKELSNFMKKESNKIGKLNKYTNEKNI